MAVQNTFSGCGLMNTTLILTLSWVVINTDSNGSLNDAGEAILILESSGSFGWYKNQSQIL